MKVDASTKNEIIQRVLSKYDEEYVTKHKPEIELHMRKLANFFIDQVESDLQQSDILESR